MSPELKVFASRNSAILQISSVNMSTAFSCDKFDHMEKVDDSNFLFWKLQKSYPRAARPHGNCPGTSSTPVDVITENWDRQLKTWPISRYGSKKIMQQDFIL